MKIKKIHVENLLSYDNFEVGLDGNFNIIVGPNNVGKTNIIRILEFLKDGVESYNISREKCYSQEN